VSCQVSALQNRFNGYKALGRVLDTFRPPLIAAATISGFP
jgi:hypothetical protein